jgi:hypothetical protein
VVSGRDRLVAEVLPFSSPFGLWQSSALMSRYSPTPRRPLHRLPSPRVHLDPVAAALCATAPSRHDDWVLMRALAAWWRVPDEAALLDRHPAPVLAAAVERAVCYWAGIDGGGYAPAAAAYRVEETRVRQAGAALQKVLRMSRQQPW